MNEKFLRVYRPFDVNDVHEHLLIYGDLAATCGRCKAINIKLEMHACPECKTEFKYVAFRNVKTNLPKLTKLCAQRSSIQVIDLEDYTHVMGAQKAQDFLRL